jgi:hypothetical protein
MSFRDLFLQQELTTFTLPIEIPMHVFADPLEPFNAEVNQAVEAYANVRTINPIDRLCDEEQCYMGTDDGLYYHDSSHLSVYGATEIVLPLLMGLETSSSSTATGTVESSQ